jgi:hypothetical protein
MKTLILAATSIFLASSAIAATLVLPSVTVTSAASTAITCSAVGAPYSAPLAAGTVVFTCSVAPASWVGAVSLSGSQFVVTALSGASFSVAVGAAALAAGSYAPGTLTSVP